MMMNQKMRDSSIAFKKLHLKYFVIGLSALIIALCLLQDSLVSCEDDENYLDPLDADHISQAATDEEKENAAKKKPYVSPKLKPENIYLFEHFDDPSRFKANWVMSTDSRYEGKWELNSGSDRPEGDLQLLLPLKARHYAISSRLSTPFEFSSKKPLIVQYEVQYRDGLDCGGSYVKLLRQIASNDLTKLNEKTPYSIMFGPDKCGSDAKIHFIIQYFNPKTQEFEEKHWKASKDHSLTFFNDKKHHIFRLELNPNNKFEVYIDEKLHGKGNLLEDLEPPINPPKEIVDVNDKKPDDWDERTHIDDPDAKKPEDWDEDAPKTIPDPYATKPSDWLHNESKYIPDPDAKKPEDWEEMDGEWQAPLIENPKCAEVSGCGEWKAPQIPNPNFKGKWKPAKISNPNYKGKWTPKLILNPNYFYDENPFGSLQPIGAVAFELWSMADAVAFDNFILTSDTGAANLMQFLTWQEKKAEADASSPSLLTRVSHYLKIYPSLWIAVVLAVAVPLIFFIAYCCDYKKSSKKTSPGVEKRKKTDESRPDDPKDDNDEDEGRDGNGDEDEDEDDDEDEDEAEAEAEAEEENSNEFEEVDAESSGDQEKEVKEPASTKKQTRQKKI